MYILFILTNQIYEFIIILGKDISCFVCLYYIVIIIISSRYIIFKIECFKFGTNTNKK